MVEEQINQTAGQLVFFLMSQNYMKDAFILHYTISLIKMLFQYQCGFRKGFSIQHGLPVMIERMKISSENKKFCTAIFTNSRKLLIVSVAISALLN